MSDISIKTIENAVRGHVPQPIGWYGYASVLLPLVNKHETLHLLYEVRSDELRKQPGEISFPGGKMEPGETPEQTAVRETCEELCIPDCAVRLITQLDYIVTYSNFTMYACLGEIDAAALTAEPNRAEVKDTFLVPLSFFLDNDPEIFVNRVAPILPADFPLEKILFKDGYSWREGSAAVPIYTWPDPDAGEDRIIWGLTARLTHRFIELIQPTQK
ncbi:MAG: CoA pyrophosphatase [Clostridiales Family XIII bacterium]|jgi:8-oxo-dGTP pyrophosphatase MutT (NUDIX family)|nr:CoA pyrophosphatase [Clostridiales Family XIII bacterium]